MDNRISGRVLSYFMLRDEENYTPRYDVGSRGNHSASPDNPVNSRSLYAVPLRRSRRTDIVREAVVHLRWWMKRDRVASPPSQADCPPAGPIHAA